jgi:hypothetical protein
VATLRNDTVVILGAGTTAITASQAGDTEYCPAPSVARPLVVERSAQTIQFAELPSRTLGDPPLWLWALATSRLPVSFTSSDTSVAAVCDGNMLYIVGAGTALISAEQHGDQNYAPAQPVAHALIVAPCPLPPAPVLDSSSVQLVVHADTVILRWYGSGSQAQRYRLVVSDPSLPVGTFHQDSSLVDTQAVVHGLLDGATYHWYVQAGNSSGWGEPSAIGMLNVQLDRVALLDASRTVRLAPHVVGARCIRYGLPVQTKVRIALLDVQGRTVWSVCKRQSPGVYTLPLRNGSVASGRYALHFSAGTYTAKRTISIAQ